MSGPNYGWLSDRTNSFLRNPEFDISQTLAVQLASLGFYSSGRGREMTCYVCGESHNQFHPGQTILEAHMESSPDCPLNVGGHDAAGAADNFGGDALEADDAAGAADNVVGAQGLPIPLPNGERPIRANELLVAAERLEYRRNTFFDWPAHYGDWEVLALNGFFYTGEGDTVECHDTAIRYKASSLRAQPGIRDTCLDSCDLK